VGEDDVAPVFERRFDGSERLLLERHTRQARMAKRHGQGQTRWPATGYHHVGMEIFGHRVPAGVAFAP
jgi:hypothetical protein